MKLNKYKNIWLWILATVILGTVWHFVYQMSGKLYPIGLISPVNESVWEHLKIVFFPFIIVGIFAFIMLKPRKTNFWTGLLAGSVVGMLIVFFGFYLYSSIIGESLVIDILLYIASIIVAMYIAWWFSINSKKIEWLEIISSLGIIIISGLLVYLTINPPKASPFIEKSSDTYGIKETKAN
jgi:hypothetical protein